MGPITPEVGRAQSEKAEGVKEACSQHGGMWVLPSWNPCAFPHYKRYMESGGAQQHSTETQV